MFTLSLSSEILHPSQVPIANFALLDEGLMLSHHLVIHFVLVLVVIFLNQVFQDRLDLDETLARSTLNLKVRLGRLLIQEIHQLSVAGEGLKKSGIAHRCVNVSCLKVVLVKDLAVECFLAQVDHRSSTLCQSIGRSECHMLLRGG